MIRVINNIIVFVLSKLMFCIKFELPNAFLNKYIAILTVIQMNMYGYLSNMYFGVNRKNNKNDTKYTRTYNVLLNCFNGMLCNISFRFNNDDWSSINMSLINCILPLKNAAIIKIITVIKNV